MSHEENEPTRSPLVTVVIPTFDRARLLSRSISSVIAQTFSNWELIVVDDGSTDDTAAIVRQWQNECPTIRYIRQDNQGVGAARNLGVSEARGFYIACLDSDDEYLPIHLETRLSLLKKHNLDFVQGGFRPDKKQQVVDFYSPSRLISIEECVIGGTIMGKRSAFLALGGFCRLNYGEDLDLWKRAQREYRVRTLREPVTYLLHATTDSLRMHRFELWQAEHGTGRR